MSVKTTVTAYGWVRAAVTRALKTGAETASALIAADMIIWELNWCYIGGVTATATLLSLLWSLRGLPEVSDNGASADDSTDDV